MDGTTGIRMQVPAGRFLCAGAVLENHRLAVGVPAEIFSQRSPKQAKWIPKVSPRCPYAAPGGPKCAPRLPKVAQRDTKGSPKRDQRRAKHSPKHTWHFKLTSKEAYIHPNSRSTAAAAIIHNHWLHSQYVLLQEVLINS